MLVEIGFGKSCHISNVTSKLDSGNFLSPFRRQSKVQKAYVQVLFIFGILGLNNRLTRKFMYLVVIGGLPKSELCPQQGVMMVHSRLACWIWNPISASKTSLASRRYRKRLL